MEFNDEKAFEIVRKFGLDEKTIKVWRTRGRIPDKYADPDFAMRKNISPALVVKHDRLTDILQSGYIHLNAFAKLSQIALHKLQDAMPGTARRVLLSEQDLIKAETELKRLKISIAKVYEKFSPLLFKRMLLSPVIAYTVVVTDRQLIDRISYIRRGKAEPDKALWLAVKDNYVIFALKLSI